MKIPVDGARAYAIRPDLSSHPTRRSYPPSFYAYLRVLCLRFFRSIRLRGKALFALGRFANRPCIGTSSRERTWGGDKRKSDHSRLSGVSALTRRVWGSAPQEMGRVRRVRAYGVLGTTRRSRRWRNQGAISCSASRGWLCHSGKGSGR